jgi:sulfate permease, SulP family
VIALLEARSAGLLRGPGLIADATAGIVVGIVAMPLAMAFAIASGATPAQGLYTAIVAGVTTAIFGGTRVQISGPTGAFIAVLATITAQYGISGLQLATLMAGIILVAMGLGRLGAVIKFIPHPVIVGFTSGIGVIIFVGQWKDFFGLSSGPTGTHFHTRLWALLSAFGTLNVPTTAIGVTTLACLILAHRFLPLIPALRRLPAPLIAMLLGTFVQAIGHFPKVATIGSAFGGIPRALPSPHLPEVNLSLLVTLVGPAFTIALLGAIESLLTAVVADGMAGTRHDPNQELIGQGAANILAPLLGGFAATGAIARTATNIRNGARSPVAGIVHALFLVLVIVLLAPWAAAIPLATLSAILFFVAWNMSDVPHFVVLVRTSPRSDKALLLLTFALTVFVDLVVAVNVGVVLAALLFMQRMATTVQVERQLPLNTPDWPAHIPLPPDALVYRIDGPFFFGAAEKLERTLERLDLNIRTVVLRFGRVPFIDATGLATMSGIVQRFHKHHVRVMVCGLHPGVRPAIELSGLLEALGRENVCENLPEVAARLVPAPV